METLTPWDDSLKMFINENRQDFVSWLLPGAHVVDSLLTEFKIRTIEADALLLVIEDGEEILLEIELQSTNDPLIGERLLSYNFEAKRTHKLPVVSCVIYLRDVGDVPQSPLHWTTRKGREVLQFHYEVIELAKIPTEVLRKTGLVGLLPLLILTEGGATHEVMEETITGLEAAGKQELLPITELLASLVFTGEAEKEWLIWRFSKMQNILRDTWAYQEMTKESREEGMREGLEKGLREGLDKGRRETLRHTLATIVQIRFPKLARMTKLLADSTENPDVLDKLIQKMVAAQSIEEAQMYLFETDELNSN
jgi:predicted transposase YdaD